MTSKPSKKLGDLLRTVPPATAASQRAELAAQAPPPPPAVATEPEPAPALQRTPKPVPVSEPEVPLQVLIPMHIHKQLGTISVNTRTSLRSLVLTAIRSLGIEVTDDEIRGKRGRRNS